MPLYEVLLQRDDHEETRMTDRAIRVGETSAIGEQHWLVERVAPPERADAAALYICIPADGAE